MPSFSLSRFKNKHFLSLLGNGVISLFGLLLFALLYRAFSKEDVGTWFFFMATQGMLDSIRNGFLNTATIKFYAGAEKERAANVMGSVWYLAIGITALMLLVNAGAFALLPFISNFQVIVSIKWVGLTLLSSLPFTVIFWKLQADEHYGTILWMRLINSGSTIVAFVVLMIMGKLTLENALIWNFITNCITSAVGMVANLGSFTSIVSRSKETITELYHFGKYSLATSLSSTLMGVANTYTCTFMLGPEAVAILSVPTKLMELVEIPLRSFVGTGLSAMATAFNQNNMRQVTYIMNKYAGMLTLAFIPMAIAVFFLADIPVNLLSSGKYRGTEAANIYRIVMFISILYPIDRFNGIALDIIHQPKVNFQKVQIMLFAKVVGNIVCVALLGKAYGIYGIQLAGLITMVAGLGFGYNRLRKFMDFSIADILSSGFYELKALSNSFLKRKKAIS